MRLGVDVGGTKIAVAVLDPGGGEGLRRRVEYRSRDYAAAFDLLVEEIREAEKQAGQRCSVGLGMPGYVDPNTELVENAFNTPYNRRPQVQRGPGYSSALISGNGVWPHSPAVP